MLDLYDEYKRLISAFAERRIDYALCGGLALAVYGVPRATVDIDLLIPAERLEKASWRRSSKEFPTAQLATCD